MGLNKTRTLRFRVNDEELDMITKKSADYPTLSSFVLDACKLYDDKLGRNKLKAINDWVEMYNQFEATLGRIGNNINQLAHYANQGLKVGAVQEAVVEKINSLMSEYKSLLREIVRIDYDIAKTLANLK